MSPLKQLVVFGEKSVFEESGFSLEKEEQFINRLKYKENSDKMKNRAFFVLESEVNLA